MYYLQISFACSLVTFLTASTACFAASAQKLRVAYSSISGNTLPLWLALDQGLFKKQNLDVEAVYVAGEPMMTQSIISGDIAAAQQGAVGAIRGNAGGLDVVVFVEPINKFNYSLVTRPDIQKVEDFKGKKMGVGGSFGGPPAFATRWVLRRFGLQPDRDVAMILIRGGGQPERLAALQAGTIDGILLSAPATLVAKRSGLRILIELADLEGEYPQTVFTTTRRFLQKQSPAAEGFVKGIVEAIAVAKLRKDIAIQVIGRRLKMSDREAQEEVYREVVEKGLGKKPYPSAKGLKVVLDELASQEPRFAKSRPEEFIDSNVVRTLDHSGFIDALYR